MSGLIAPRTPKSISLTALIDVVFILLMFFMLTSSFSTRHEMPLQTAAAALEASDDKEPIALALDASGRLHTLPEGDVVGEQWLSELDGDDALVIYPYSNTEVQTMVTQLQHLKLLGLSRVNLGESLPEKL